MLFYHNASSILFKESGEITDPAKLLISLQLLTSESICGDLITKYMQGVIHNQLATSGDITQGITPYLCLSSIYNMFHLHLSFRLHYHMHKLTWNV